MNRLLLFLMPAAASAAQWLGMSAALAGPEPHTDLEIGRNAQNQLVIEGDEDLLSGAESILLLPGEGFFDGLFANEEPGFEAIEMDEGPDLLALLQPHSVALKRLAFSPGFEMYEPPFSAILTADGGTYAFVQDGDGGFHNDLIFAAAGAVGDTFSATFQLVDLASPPQHADSGPFTLSFRIVPEPSALALMACGMVATRRRRRTA